ncbi:UNVERIFIED_CONTAM: hypothetical protein FKN15_003824 [Acipenser sinensis]
MANNTVDHPPGNSVAEGNHEGEFGCSVADLRGLMELRSGEAVANIRDRFDDVQGICRKLKTSPIEGLQQIKVIPPAAAKQRGVLGLTPCEQRLCEPSLSIPGWDL